MQNKIPANIFMGFLGSGKTTVISHLIDYLTAKGEKVVYIKNEVGDNDLDTKLMADKDIETEEMTNGCVCCTLVGALNIAIDKLADKYHPDRFIIESAGTASPESLSLTISSHPRLIRDSVISIIDVVNFNGYDSLNTIAQSQATFNDLIVFNKVELVDDARKKAVVGYVRELNEYSPIVEAPHGKLNPDIVFGLASTLDATLASSHHDHSHHQHDDGIEAFTYKSDKQFNQLKLDDFLKNLPNNFFRIKGVVKFEAGLKILNGVYKRFDYFDPPAKNPIDHTEIIFIGFRITGEKDNIFSKLNELASQNSKQK